MKKLLSLPLVLLMLLCGMAFAEAADYVGVWELTSVEFDGTHYAPEDMGVDMTMTLNRDGSALLDSGSVSGPAQGYWVETSRGITVYDDVDNPMALVLSNGKLVSDIKYGLKMNYTRRAAASVVPGDADGNASVGIADAIAILDYCAGGNAAVNTSNADVNADGRVDLHDALLVLQYVAGWNVTLK